MLLLKFDNCREFYQILNTIHWFRNVCDLHIVNNDISFLYIKESSDDNNICLTAYIPSDKFKIFYCSKSMLSFRIKLTDLCVIDFNSMNDEDILFKIYQDYPGKILISNSKSNYELKINILEDDPIIDPIYKPKIKMNFKSKKLFDYLEFNKKSEFVDIGIDGDTVLFRCKNKKISNVFIIEKCLEFIDDRCKSSLSIEASYDLEDIYKIWKSLTKPFYQKLNIYVDGDNIIILNKNTFGNIYVYFKAFYVDI